MSIHAPQNPLRPAWSKPGRGGRKPSLLGEKEAVTVEEKLRRIMGKVLGVEETELISTVKLADLEADSFTELAKQQELRRGLEAAAIAEVDCPNCGALAGQRCRRGSEPKPMHPVDTHKKRLTRFVAEKVRVS